MADFSVIIDIDENSPLTEHVVHGSYTTTTEESFQRSLQDGHRRARRVKSSQRLSESLSLQIARCFLGLWYPRGGLDHIAFAKSAPTRSSTTTTGTAMTMKASCNNDHDAALVIESSKCSDEKAGNDNDHDSVLEGSRRGNLCATIFSLAYLGIFCGLMVYDFVEYLRFYWGKHDQLLHLVSYFTFLWQVMVIPFWCLYGRVFYHLWDSRRLHATRCPFIVFFGRRVTVGIGVSCFRLMCFLLWPCINGALRVLYSFKYYTCDYHVVHEQLTMWTAVTGYVMYGSFCYLIYIERMCHEHEVEEVTRFTRSSVGRGNIEEVRAKIFNFYAHYRVLSSQLGAWMGFTMIVATWGLTAHVTWNYQLFSDTKIRNEDLPNIHLLNLLISSQKIMFFFLPCVALGGLNMEHVWQRLRYNIAQSQEYAAEAYWSKVIRYVRDINVNYAKNPTPTLLFSAIGFYIGLNLGKGDQQVNLWSGPYLCNNTTSYLQD